MPQENSLKKPRSFDEMFPGRFLKAGLLLGKHATYTISEVVIDKLEGDKGMEIKGILRFREIKEELSLCKTNGLCLKAMFGDVPEAWEGKRVTVKPDRTKFGAETVDCIRFHGSPDIDTEKQVRIKLPKKKEFFLTMHRTGAESGATNRPAAPPAPSIADYEQCPSLQALRDLETRRRAAWPGVAAADRAPLEAAKEKAKARLQSTPQTTNQQAATYDEASLVIHMQDGAKSKDVAAIERAWSAIVAHYDSVGAEIPVDVDATYQYAKESAEQ